MFYVVAITKSVKHLIQMFRVLHLEIHIHIFYDWEFVFGLSKMYLSISASSHPTAAHERHVTEHP